MDDAVEQAVRFHGHMCPGLAIGIRAAQIALREVGSRAEDEEVVAIVETDMCAVDAIQCLVGCTFGKGNLIHRDYGKNAFTFVRRPDGKAIRLVARPSAWGRERKGEDGEDAVVVLESVETQDALRHERSRRILEMDEGELFTVTPVSLRIPTEARAYPSRQCAECGEDVMETRIRIIGGHEVCIPCFERRERRW